MDENENNTQTEYPHEYGAIIPILELNKQVILELDLVEIEVIIQVSSYLKKLVISLTPNIIRYYIDNNQSIYLERWAYGMMRKHQFEILSKLCNTAYDEYNLYIGHNLLDKLLDDYSTHINPDVNGVSKCYESLKFILIEYNIEFDDFIEHICNIENDTDKLFTLLRDLTILMSDNVNTFPIVHYIIHELSDNHDRQKNELGRLKNGFIELRVMLNGIG
jgi:hypothetical protein